MRHHCIHTVLDSGDLLQISGRTKEGEREEEKEKEWERKAPLPLRRRVKFPTRCKTKFTKFAQRLVGSLPGSLHALLQEEGEEWA